MAFSTILLFGPPGSGKGTQGRVLGQLPGFCHFACGDAFRNLDVSTSIGQAFLRYSSRGELVPDDLTIQLWRQQTAALVRAGSFKPSEDILVLDGIPRSLTQAQLLGPFLHVRRIFHLTCSDEESLVQRIKHRALHSHRLDDANEKVIRQRLRAYRRDAATILDFYGSHLVTCVDALEPPATVLHQILSHFAGMTNGLAGETLVLPHTKKKRVGMY